MKQRSHSKNLLPWQMPLAIQCYKKHGLQAALDNNIPIVCILSNGFIGAFSADEEKLREEFRAWLTTYQELIRHKRIHWSFLQLLHHTLIFTLPTHVMHQHNPLYPLLRETSTMDRKYRILLPVRMRYLLADLNISGCE